MQKPASIHNEEAWLTSCQNVVSTARAILSQDLSIIEGARKLCSLRFDVKAERDDDFMLFVGIESETDHLPIGIVQAKWNSTALENKKKEIENFENSIREKAFQACSNLIERYRV